MVCNERALSDLLGCKRSSDRDAATNDKFKICNESESTTTLRVNLKSKRSKDQASATKFEGQPREHKVQLKVCKESSALRDRLSCKRSSERVAATSVEICTNATPRDHLGRKKGRCQFQCKVQ